MKANPFSKIKNMISACFETNTLKSVLSGAGIKSNLLIFDVGAHKGQTSSHFSKLFPHSFIHAFEPSPYLFPEIKKNLSNKKNIRCHNCALGEADEEAFLTKPDSDLCGQVVKAQENNSSSISVNRLDGFCQIENISAIDLLKIDVEGYEKNVLKGADSCLKQKLINFIYVETGLDTRFNSIQELVDCLHPLGYMPYAFYEQAPHWTGKQNLWYWNTLFAKEELL